MGEHDSERTVHLKAGQRTNIYGLGSGLSGIEGRISLCLSSYRGYIIVESVDAILIDKYGQEITLVSTPSRD